MEAGLCFTSADTKMRAIVFATLLGASIAAPAAAQDLSTREIIVTGSRIDQDD